MLNILIVAVTLLTAGVLFYPRVANAPLWRATITPLASIIGSGFLVLGPILETSYGKFAPLVMALLCGVAYLFGWAVRFNIASTEERELPTLAARLDTASSGFLAFAYVVSVSYYLNLFGAFGVTLTPYNDPLHARILTTAMFLLILGVGLGFGFKAMERMEQLSVGLKLAIIAGLLLGLGWFFFAQASAGKLHVNPPTLGGFKGITLGFGLIVTVQGFETSRYLGANYDAATRIRSMRLAQWLATVIYMIYIVFLAYSFERGSVELSETAIIDMMKVVSTVLPALLVAAALSAQFSAAVADTSGSGGLIHEISGGRIPEPIAYAILIAIGIGLTWTLNVFEIISYASRAFALYYALQCAVAAVTAWQAPRKLPHTVAFGALAGLGVAVTVFGTPVE
jgi:hypothetical protein